MSAHDNCESAMLFQALSGAMMRAAGDLLYESNRPAPEPRLGKIELTPQPLASGIGPSPMTAAVTVGRSRDPMLCWLALGAVLQIGEPPAIATDDAAAPASRAA